MNISRTIGPFTFTNDDGILVVNCNGRDMNFSLMEVLELWAFINENWECRAYNPDATGELPQGELPEEEA